MKDISEYTVCPDSTLREVIKVIDSGAAKIAMVVDDVNNLIGIITDGDIRRMLENEGADWGSLVAKDIMSEKPKTIQSTELAAKALTIMEDNNISQLIVCKGESYHGIVHIHDILKEGIL